LGNKNTESWENGLIKSLEGKEILVYCSSPKRAVIAYCRLLQMGYPNVKRFIIDQKELKELDLKIKNKNLAE